MNKITCSNPLATATSSVAMLGGMRGRTHIDTQFAKAFCRFCATSIRFNGESWRFVHEKAKESRFRFVSNNCPLHVLYFLCRTTYCRFSFTVAWPNTPLFSKNCTLPIRIRARAHTHTARQIAATVLHMHFGQHSKCTSAQPQNRHSAGY